VLPLYPQSSGATTGAVYDQVADGLRSWRAMPELRYVASYFDAPEYIDALAASVREHWNLHGRNGHLLMSFHGIPLSYVTRGDRYAEECHATAALLAAALELAPQDWSLSFQSRFGANRWLTPATDSTLAELPRRGIRATTLICPGFAVDCLETLEEIALRGRGALRLYPCIEWPQRPLAGAGADPAARHQRLGLSLKANDVRALSRARHCDHGHCRIGAVLRAAWFRAGAYQ